MIEVGDTIHQDDLQRIIAGLNEAKVGQVPPDDKRPLTILWRENGRLLGGLTGHTQWGWLYIKLLWVAPQQRGSGLGRQLMLAAESEAQQRGCHAAFVNTFSFQAPTFYQKLGYTIWGQLEEYPAGYQRIYLQKKL